VCVCVCFIFVLYCNTPENELTGEARAASNHIQFALTLIVLWAAGPGAGAGEFHRWSEIRLW
jgi:hypothetical protein